MHPPLPFASSLQALPPSTELIFQASQDVHEASTSAIPQLPISPEHFNTPSASPPMTPTHIPTCALPPGTPLSRQHQESLRQEEQRGRKIIEEFRAWMPLDILENDDWDIPDEQDDEDEAEDNHNHEGAQHAGAEPNSAPIAVGAVLSTMQLEPEFQVLPVCPNCLEVYPLQADGPTICSRCNSFIYKATPANTLRNANNPPTPLLRFPYKTIESQLINILAVPGVEAELDKWRTRTWTPGKYGDIFDGDVPKNLKGHDGLPFFRNIINAVENGPNGELQIGLTLGVDCYRTANLMLSGIMPGPKEQDYDEIQRFLRIIVNELLRLWAEGFQSRTDAEQRRLGEEYANLNTANARDNFVKKYATHWTELAQLPYFDLVCMITIDPMHNLLLGLVKTHFYHIWVQTKILRKTKELCLFHKILAEFSLPAYLGRLPALMGVPAGGSLTADQWLLMATIVGPIAILQIWHDYMPDPDVACSQRQAAIDSCIRKKKTDAEAAKKARAAKKRKTHKTHTSTSTAPQSIPDIFDEPTTGASDAPNTNRQRQKRKRTEDAGGNNESDEDDSEQPSCLHPDDPANFLMLLKALRILLGRELTEEQIDEADKLLCEYCSDLVDLYGTDMIRPNHHYATHTPRSVRDYGPLHEFWTFLFEHLNKVLKSYKTNNRSGGELEVASAGCSDQPDFFQAAVSSMFKASSDNRGTVQALAKELDEAQEDVNQHCYFASSQAPNRTNSLVECVVYANDGSSRLWTGELIDIIHINQAPTGVFTLAQIHWFRPLHLDIADTIWHSYKAIGVHLWHADQFLGQAESGPPRLLPLHHLQNHVAMYEVNVNDVRAWATISVGKV
ncbi:hypothetical protein PILCRDRAFT_89847 [Piloderma croceum F 1598]|uniref:Uncharacterized protein n=1 Tax=Piloderma croceum (strain F 1598) TaxID=765440 RepID=A0A0C3FKD0_PILCF|nr:hypothetical protein PILCRDRAFT_89847 [Piloderma croceum F 1598]